MATPFTSCVVVPAEVVRSEAPGRRVTRNQQTLFAIRHDARPPSSGTSGRAKQCLLSRACRLLVKVGHGLRWNEYIEGDGETIFRQGAVAWPCAH
jgi:hypothetical protein